LLELLLSKCFIAVERDQTNKQTNTPPPHTHRIIMYRGVSVGNLKKTKPDFTIKISGLWVLNGAGVVSNLEILSASILILLGKGTL
jgi:hypothetical protein